MFEAEVVDDGVLRQLRPQWNYGLVAASVGISLLGAFTSTQLVCQARLSRYLSGVVLWTFLASLTFGFCSIWCLHFVAMLACELDLPIGLNTPLTILSALLAVSFTFASLASDLVLDRYKKRKNRRKKAREPPFKRDPECRATETPKHVEDTRPLLGNVSPRSIVHSPSQQPWTEDSSHLLLRNGRPAMSKRTSSNTPNGEFFDEHANGHVNGHAEESFPGLRQFEFLSRSPVPRTALSELTSVPPFRIDATPTDLEQGREGRDSIDSGTEESERRVSDATSSDGETLSLGPFSNIRTYKVRSTITSHNPFKATAVILWAGITCKNLSKGFIWSLAITTMHYAGVSALTIPHGRCVLRPLLVLLSAIISWIVCTVGCILMSQMESNLAQQCLFSLVASTGVAAMHFTGMAATTFWSTAPPSVVRGYPSSLSITIVTIAIVTCLAANGLLAHSATMARNKLTEIIRTRRKLWAALAQKEHAEANAQARSEFIASASHEIRTPLHQLQGYSDLLSRETLTEEGRLLLLAIQDATKTLSLITNNVLDWSRLEKGESINRPVSLDVRSVCDSVVSLLPNRDEDKAVEILVAIAPNVPDSLLIDELGLTRIVLNLLSNACKFTTHGYVLLRASIESGNLVATVTDTGCGIPTTFLPQLFEPFTQAQTLGAERGTGLGLSIVRQLLEKMQGTIEVESKFRDDAGVGSENQGSLFTVSIPVFEAANPSQEEDRQSPRPRVALFENRKGRVFQGLQRAWDAYGYEAVQVQKFEELPESSKYVWVSICALKKDPDLLRQLSSAPQRLVLVPYDNENDLFETIGARPPPHFVVLRRPLAWHQIMKSIKLAGQRPMWEDVGRPTVRFAAEVDVQSAPSIADSASMGNPSDTSSSPTLTSSPTPKIDAVLSPLESPPTPLTILLVEDNKINQKLGAKMLKTLGYRVILAEDGQQAIDLLQIHDQEIDCILMDQSMPVKDGLVATKEIREMESRGLFKGSRKLHDPSQRPRRIIIAVTAVVGPAHESMCKAVGTDAFLTKPLSLGRLKDCLEEWLKSGYSQA